MQSISTCDYEEKITLVRAPTPTKETRVVDVGPITRVRCPGCGHTVTVGYAPGGSGASHCGLVFRIEVRQLDLLVRHQGQPVARS